MSTGLQRCAARCQHFGLADGAGAGVGGRRRGAQRRRRRDARRIGDRHVEALDGIAGGMNDELVARRHAGAYGYRQAIEQQRIEGGSRAGEGDRGARVLAPHRVAGAGARDHVVVGGERAEIHARSRGHGAGGVGRGRHHAYPAHVEEVAAQRAGEVHALAMLGVDLRGHGQRDAAQLVAGRIEHLLAPVEQSAELAARDAARDVHGARCSLQRQLHAFGVERILGRGDLRGRGAQHQRLAGADEHIQRGLAFGDHADAHLRGKLVDERVALIEQVVGRMAGLLNGSGDVAVQARDALREHIDFAGLRRPAASPRSRTFRAGACRSP